MCLKSLQKYSLRLNAASHNNASWYTDTHGFLERLPSGGSLKCQGHALQKIVLDILGGGPSPCIPDIAGKDPFRRHFGIHIKFHKPGLTQ